MPDPRPRPPLSRATARNYVLLNLLGTPGLGSFLARRRWVGVAQLILAMAGFGFFLAWFVAVIWGFYGMITDQALQPKPKAWLALTGVILFALAWLWSLITSFGILREAKKTDPPDRLPPLPPPVI